MPIKLCASVCKKLPDELQYSSKSYLASVELELSNNLSAEELNAEIQKTYAQLERAVDEQIAGKASGEPGQAKKPVSDSSKTSVGLASNKQIKFILDLGKAREKVLGDLNAEVAERFHVESIYDLSRKEASLYLDMLKAA